MADNHANNEKFAPPTAEDEEAAWILLSFKDNDANTNQAGINISNATTPDKGTTQQAAQVDTLKHAISLGAPVPTPASTSGTQSRLIISGGQAVQKPKISEKPFTNRLSSDIATTSSESQRGVDEQFVVSSDHTILAGRTETKLGQRTKEALINQIRRAEYVLPSRSVDNSPTMTAAQRPLSLRTAGFPKVGGENPAHETPINPFNGAQTTTAQHFMQTTANSTTAKDDARRAHSNNANELAKSLEPPVNNYNDFPITDGKGYAVIKGNGPATPRPSHQSYDAVAAAAGTPKCSTFRPVYIHTAKCDECNTRNRSVLYRCNTCSTQLDRACMTNNHEHGAQVNNLDWTDHGAQSASKPRGAAASRVKKTPAKNVAVKKKVSLRDEAALERQFASNDEKDKKKQKKRKTREANSLSKSTDEAFEDDDFMMLSSRVCTKRENRRVGSPLPERKRVCRSVVSEKRKGEEDDIYEVPDDNVRKASKAPRQPFTTLGDGGVQSQQRASTWFKSAQPKSPAARSSGLTGINSFFAEADHLKEEYTRVSVEIESKRTRLAELQAEKDGIEAKILKRMGN